jgi:hypothetical protein
MFSFIDVQKALLKAACPAEKLSALEGNLRNLDAMFDELQGLFADDSVARRIVTKWRSNPSAFEENLMGDSRSEVLEQHAITKEEFMLAQYSPPNKTDANIASVVLRLLRNDPALTHLDLEQLFGRRSLLISRWSYPLVRALRNNTKVSSVRFYGYEKAVMYPAHMKDCLRECADLEIYSYEDFGQQLFRAVAESPFIEKVYIPDTCDVSGEGVVHLLQTTTSIKSIRFPMPEDHDSRVAVVQALWTSRTLQDISLSLQWDGPQSDAILSSLKPLLLRSLAVRGPHGVFPTSHEVVESVCSFLCGNQSLLCLELGDIFIHSSDMPCFLESCSESVHLSKLNLASCTLPDLADLELVRFLQTTKIIEDLHLRSCQHVEALTTLPSSLKALHIQTVRGRSVELLARCAPNIRLHRLSFRDTRATFVDWDAQLIIRFISGLVSLRELEIMLDKRNRSDLPSTGLILAALKQNACLHQVSLLWTFADHENAWSQSEENLIRALGLRNQRLPILLLGETNDPADLVLLPMLFTVARQISATGPNSIFTGLLRFEGPDIIDSSRTMENRGSDDERALDCPGKNVKDPRTIDSARVSETRGSDNESTHDSSGTTVEDSGIVD